jgi:aerobic-type carbon monoxide dehydrogenase small subunit (CoxS/CutS family)
VRRHLVDFLREDLGLTGSHLGCEHGVCGACQVMLDGQRRQRGCLTLAVRADGRRVDTVEGLSDSGALARIAAGLPRAQRLPVRLLLQRHAALGRCEIVRHPP